MAEQSGFFDAHLVEGVYDRVYLAESFAKYFASFIGNGVFGGKSNELIVKQQTSANMSVRVLEGQAWINGYWYENDSELSLAIDVADGVLNRIDLIVLQWNNSERVIRLAVRKGTSASNPAAPILQRNADYYELKLAEVRVKAGATSITQADITDTRLNTSVCGLVTSVIDQLDTEEYGIQLNSYIENYQAEYNAFLEQLKASGTNDLNALKAELNTIVADNDLVQLSRDVAALKLIAVESAEYKGCYYRVFEGRTEWINPPSQYGTEYCTTERWQNKPVYQKTFYAASLPNNSIMTFEVDTAFDLIISIDGFAIDTDNNYYYAFPVILDGVTPVAVIRHFEGDGGAGGIVVVKTTDDVSYMRAYITVKYTKS